jgi:protein disulfide-isomerase A1
LADHLGVQESEYPLIMIIKAGNYGFEKWKFLGNMTDLSVNYVKAFVTSWNAGTLKPFYRSEPIPTEDGKAVQVIVGDSWTQIAEDPDKDVLV